MKHILLYIIAALLFAGCWSDDDGENNYAYKPERVASATVEKAMGLLCELLYSTNEQGDTTLTHQQITVFDKYSTLGYALDANDVQIVWESMPGDETIWGEKGNIVNTRLLGSGVIRTVEDSPLILEFTTQETLIFKTARHWGYAYYDDPQTRLLSGIIHIKVSGGQPGDHPTEFTMTLKNGKQEIEKN